MVNIDPISLSSGPTCSANLIALAGFLGLGLDWRSELLHNGFGRRADYRLALLEKSTRRQASKTEEVEMIDQIPLFEDLSEETLSTLQQQIRQRKLAKGEHLFSPGDDSDSMYLVQSGRMRIWTVSAAGAEITLNVLTPGTVFGEIGLLDGSERTAGASALDAVELMSISRAAFDNALDRDPQLARNVIAFLCERLRWISARLEDSALRSAPERLARMLVHLSNDYGVDSAEGIQLSINLTQGELARWTQMSRESLNKTLNRWADEGLLAQSRGKITVKDRDRLEDIAEFGEEE